MSGEANRGGGYGDRYMRRRGKQIACLLVAATLALPAAAFGQSAGDEQYDDPFAPEEQTGGGGSQPEPTPEPEPEAPVAPATPSAEPAQAPAPSSDGGGDEGGGGQLPYTGADSALLALAGGTLLVSGLALRRRTRPSADRA
jgi:LPXTG-motif cell wall-anchored protein